MCVYNIHAGPEVVRDRAHRGELNGEGKFSILMRVNAGRGKGRKVARCGICGELPGVRGYDVYIA